MRSCLVGAAALSVAMSSSGWAQSDRDIGFHPHAFALYWTALSTARFQPVPPAAAPLRIYGTKPVAVGAGRMQPILDAAFASARDDRDRREVALDEMMTPWPQPQRHAFQQARDAAEAYAAGDDRTSARFAALARRVADGTGRSAAVDGSASSALDSALASTLARQDAGARDGTDAAQRAFVAYREAFAAFADVRAPGTGTAVAAELDRQRAADLARTR